MKRFIVGHPNLIFLLANAIPIAMGSFPLFVVTFVGGIVWLGWIKGQLTNKWFYVLALFVPVLGVLLLPNKRTIKPVVSPVP